MAFGSKSKASNSSPHSVPRIKAFEKGADAGYLSARPLPPAPDGRYDSAISQNASIKNKGAHSRITTFIDTLSKVKPPKPDLQLIEAFIDAHNHPDAVNDRLGAFTNALGFLSSLPPELTSGVSSGAINVLYNTIPHPPAAFLSDAHVFRQADGGGNSLVDFDLGRAGTAYARSVPPKYATAATGLPDPGLIFDSILKRRTFVKHPGGNSAFTFAFATLVTHSLFRTDSKDWSKNNTSSYLDLSPLYGINQATQDLVRDKASGRGLLYPDSFSEDRLYLLPPAASVLLIILSRNHNYIAETLLKINERGKWNNPPLEDPVARAKQDEELFQTAKLVNCGHFMSLILGDYAPAFLGISQGSFWDIPALDKMKFQGAEIPRGQGNHVSVEFNMLYHWHGTLSVSNEKWVEKIFLEAFSGKNPRDTLPDMRSIAEYTKKYVDTPPKDRTLYGIPRGEGGRYDDDILAKILQDATSEAGGAYGARGIPESMRFIEVLGIQQSRSWGVCTMNEFREFLGLKRFTTFEEWSGSDTPEQLEVANAARKLYGHVNNLELYPGLQAEQTMPVTTGSCIAAGYTTTRAILGDAIAMVRGDRHYTTEFTPAALTAWGFQDCARDHRNGGLGGNMPKLLTRHLPRHYPYNNIYSTYPYFTPEGMHDQLASRKLDHLYVFERPGKPVPIAQPIQTLTGIDYIFNDPVKFKHDHDLSLIPAFDVTTTSTATATATEHYKEKSSSTVRSSMSTMGRRERLLKALPESTGWWCEKTASLIKEKTWQYDGVPGNYIDIVQVANAVAVHWACKEMCALPIKTREQPRGIYTECELWDRLATLYTHTFLTSDDNERKFSIEWASKEFAEDLKPLIAKSIIKAEPSTSPNLLGNILSSVACVVLPSSSPDKRSQSFLKAVAESKKPLKDLIESTLGLAICSSVSYAHAAVLVVDFYLGDERSKERSEMIALAQKEDPESRELFNGYVREGMRLNPHSAGVYRNVVEDSAIPVGEKQSVNVKKGDRIWASLKHAFLNSSDFPEPLSVDPRRPKASYRFEGLETQSLPDVVSEIVRVTFGLKGIRRAEGAQGQLIGIKQNKNGTDVNVYMTSTGALTHLPGPMNLVFD